MGRASPFDEHWFERPNQDDRITTRIDVTAFQWARSGALRAHATQVDPAEAWWFGARPMTELAAVWPWEDMGARPLAGRTDPRRATASPTCSTGSATRRQRAVMTTVQYRVVVGKNDERVDGPDDAEVVITVPLADVPPTDFDPVVAFMQGRLKSAGSTGALFTLLRRAGPAAALSRLASRPELAVADQHGAGRGEQVVRVGSVGASSRSSIHASATGDSSRTSGVSIAGWMWISVTPGASVGDRRVRPGRGCRPASRGRSGRGTRRPRPRRACGTGIRPARR